MSRWQMWSFKSIRRLQIRVICCVPRELPRSPHFSQPARPSQSMFTRPTPMLLRPICQRHLTTNRKKRSSSSSVRTGTSLNGSHLTCQVYSGDWLSTVCKSTQRQNPLRSISIGPPRRRERQLARRWLGFWPLSSFARYTTPSGSPMS